MTIVELRQEVRAIVPQNVSTCVGVDLWDHWHDWKFDPHGSRETKVNISAHFHGRCEQVDATTPAAALTKFIDEVLPQIMGDANERAEQAAAEIDCELTEAQA